MRALLLAIVVPALALSAPASRADDVTGYRVVVHPSNAADTISRRQLSDVYLKKVTRWPDGSAVHPVEPPENSVTRAYFLSEVLGKSAFAVRTFWNKRVFAGRDTPPVEKRSDEEVLAFVRATPGAIGYVAPTSLVEGVKVLPVKD
jgi:ABC-type phosphate transport system substrate-binding protein